MSDSEESVQDISFEDDDDEFSTASIKDCFQEADKKQFPKVKLPDDEPETHATLPLGKKKPDTHDEEELPAEEIAKPTPKNPKQLLKNSDPEKLPDNKKLVLQNKTPTVEPNKKKFPKVKLPDDEPETHATLPLGKKKPDTHDEEELPAEEIAKPTPKNPKQLLKNSDPEKLPDNKKPVLQNKTPTVEPNKKKFPKVKLPDDEPETHATLPLGKKKPDTHDEEELPAEEIAKPTPKNPKQLLKNSDPEKLPDNKKPVLQNKTPTVEPNKKKFPKVKLPDDEPETHATLPLGKKKPDTHDEEELPAEEIAKPTPKNPKQLLKNSDPEKLPDNKKPVLQNKTPTVEPNKKKFPKVKLPDDEPETRATLPLGKKKPDTHDEEELPAEEIAKPTPKNPKQLLKNSDPEKLPDNKKPVLQNKTPTVEPNKKKFPKVKLPDDEPETHATLPLGKKKPDTHDEEELPAEEIAKPTPKNPKQLLKNSDPEKLPDNKKPVLQNKTPTVEPNKKKFPKVKLPDDEPETHATLPLGKKKPDTHDEEELPAEEIAKPTPKNPKQLLKNSDPEKLPDNKKPVLQNKTPTVEPNKKKFPKVKLPDDEPETHATLPLGKKKPDTHDEEELPAEEIAKPTPKNPKQLLKNSDPEKLPDNKKPVLQNKTPTVEPNKKKFPKVKLPDDEPETHATLPLGKKKPDTHDEEELPAEEIAKPTPKNPKQLLKNSDFEKLPDNKKPVLQNKTPTVEPNKKKFPKVKLPDDEPETHATLPLGKKKPDTHDEEELPAEEIAKPTPKNPKQLLKNSDPEKLPDNKKPVLQNKTPTVEPNKKKFPKVKLPDDEPETRATLPLGKKKPDTHDEEELPAEEIAKPTPKNPKQLLKNSDPEKLPDNKKPVLQNKTPTVEPNKKKFPKVKLPDDEPETHATLPLGKKKPDTHDEEELPAEEIAKPTPKNPKQLLKNSDPEKLPDNKKPVLQNKTPTVEPNKKKFPKVKLPDDEPETHATLPLGKKKPDTHDEEELPAEEIAKPTPKNPKQLLKNSDPEKLPDNKKPVLQNKTPTVEPNKKKFPKVKLPDDEPETHATLPLGKKKPDTHDEEELPAEEIAKPTPKNPKQLLKNSDFEKLPDNKKPVLQNKTPTVEPNKKKFPKVKFPDDEPEAHVTLPLGEEKSAEVENLPLDGNGTLPINPKGKRKRKPINSSQRTENEPRNISAKPRWVPPVKAVEEYIPIPPPEKSLVQRNKEERILPTQRYSKKKRSVDVYIPFIIPWEQRPARMTQEGMGAFGKTRDAAMKIGHGRNELKQGNLKTETVIPLLNDNRGLANRSGMLPFGSRRLNLGVVVDNHEFSNIDDGSSDSIIPFVNRGTINHGHPSIGGIRPQVADVEYTDKMNLDMNQMSHGFISRYFAPHTKMNAGSNVMDRRRGEITPCGSESHESKNMIPLIFNTPAVEEKGSMFGSFRPLFVNSTGGYCMKFDDELRCKNAIPFQTAPSLTA